MSDDQKPCTRCSKLTQNTCITCANPLCPACEEDDPMCADCRAKVQQGGQSEVKRLLEIIDLEYQSAQQALYGFVQGTSQHEFITKRMEGIDRMRERVIDLVGDEHEANKMVIEQLDKSAKTQELKEDEGGQK